MMTESEFMAVGVILKAQGIRGEVKATPFTTAPQHFQTFKRVWLKTPAGLRELQIERLRFIQQNLLIKFAGVDSMNDAIALGRGELLIPRAERPSLPDGSYYQDQIKGMAVCDIHGVSLGRVTQILKTGANDVYVVSDGHREILLPAIKSVIKQIDCTAGVIRVELLPGLVEDEV
jgi:16S rRNA processing protein RimM